MNTDNQENEDLGPFDLGFAGLPDSEDPVDNVSALLDLVNQTDNHINEAQNAVAQIARECLDRCSDITGDCDDCIRGHVLRYIDATDKIIAKIHNKLIDSVTSTVVDTATALNNVAMIADAVNSGSEELENPVQLPEIPIDDSELQRIASERGAIFSSTPTSRVDEKESATPISGHVPPSLPPIGSSTGSLSTPENCVCPAGWQLIDTNNGVPPANYVCFEPVTKATRPCGVTPPPPPPPNCINFTELACGGYNETPCIVLNGKQVTIDELIQHCQLCCLATSSNLSCEQILQCFNVVVPTPPPPPPPPPPTQDDLSNAGACEVIDPSEQLEDMAEWESGSLSEYGQEISTEDDPIVYTDPTTGKSVVVPVGQTDPTQKVAKCGKMSIDDMLQQGLRNGGKVQVGSQKNNNITFTTQDTPIGRWDYCDLKEYSKVKDVVAEYSKVAYEFGANNAGTGGIISGTKALYSMMAGPQSDTLDVPIIAGYAAKAGFSIAKNLLAIKTFQDTIPYPNSCDIKSYTSGFIINEMIQELSNSAGFVPKPIITSFEYLQNYQCQYLLPSVNDFDNMYIAGRINIDQWEFGQKMYGYCVDWKRKSIESQRPQIPAEVVYGWCRADLIDDDEKKNLLSYVGICDKTAVDNFELSSEALPGPSDLMRFMVRDVEDESVVTKYCYDDEFDDKFKGCVKEWALRQNMTEKVAKRYWRSHWQIPSVGQGYEMYHRLRPEKGLKDSKNESMEFTKEDLAEMLKINDMAPGFVDKLTEISFRPIGIRQVARAYETDTVKAEDIQGYYQDLGYSKDDSKTLSSYVKVDRAESRAKFLGRPLPSQLEKFFINGEIGEETYRDELLKAGYTTEIVESKVDYARVKGQIADNEIRVKAAKTKYLKGMIDEQEYENTLSAIGIDQERISSIIRRDREVKSSRNKEIVVGKLCSLVKQGLMNPTDYFTRAINFGYKVEDASLLVQSCMVEYQEALQKKVEKQIKEAAALVAKQAAKAEKVRKEMEKAEKAKFPCKNKAKPTCPPGVVAPE